jgi:hypothetical protein
MAYPSGRINLGINTGRRCTAHASPCKPLGRNAAEYYKVVISLDIGKFSKQAEIGTETSESLDIAAYTLRRCVENAIMTIRIIKSIAKCAIIVGPRPIGRLPWTGMPPDSMNAFHW